MPNDEGMTNDEARITKGHSKHHAGVFTPKALNSIAQGRGTPRTLGIEPIVGFFTLKALHSGEFAMV
jgi:hypothetical protein